MTDKRFPLKHSGREEQTNGGKHLDNRVDIYDKRNAAEASCSHSCSHCQGSRSARIWTSLKPSDTWGQITLNLQDHCVLNSSH